MYFALTFVLVFFAAWIIAPIGIVLYKLLIGTPSISTAVLFVLGGILIYILAIVIITEVYVSLAYLRWMYEFTDDHLKIERGIIWKKYSNIPYERVQNVDIRRGIIARMLGFSSLMIQTAGYSAQPMAEGYIPAVSMEEAERIREFVMNKVTKGRKHQGL